MNYYTFVCSPLGELLLISDGTSLIGLYTTALEKNSSNFKESQSAFIARPALDDLTHQQDLPVFKEAAQQIAEYFSLSRTEFELPIKFEGTEFQKKVWNELRKIPYGMRVTYAQLANEIGTPSAIRAVGSANARNPLSIVVPCHRVVAANGDLRGYAGGIDRKNKLLTLESYSRKIFS